MRKNMKKLIQNEEMKAAKKEIMGCQKRLPLERKRTRCNRNTWNWSKWVQLAKIKCKQSVIGKIIDLYYPFCIF